MIARLDMIIGISPVRPLHQDPLRLTGIDRTPQAAMGGDRHLHTTAIHECGHAKGHVLLTPINGPDLHIMVEDPHHPTASRAHDEGTNTPTISRDSAEAGKAPDEGIQHHQIARPRGLLIPTIGTEN